MKIQFYSAIFLGLVLTLVVVYLSPNKEIIEPECREIVQVYRTATYTFDYCVDNDTVLYRDEWKPATFIEGRLYEIQSLPHVRNQESYNHDGNVWSETGYF